MRRTKTTSDPTGGRPAPLGFSSQQVADLAGITIRAMRHYHDIGLLPEPERTSSGYRAYRPEHVLLLMRVKSLTQLGLSLEQVAEVLIDPEGDQAELIVIQLDQALADRITEIQHQRHVLAEWRQSRSWSCAGSTARTRPQAHAA
ncbi:MAG: MerR family transcriptional regulator [Propionibacteriaceae bacterium]|jgi:DNA-binding transcriptional MerR regulator|nr:MerR family transcriptional regulator [Propionibacteriaceae bacterium]